MNGQKSPQLLRVSEAAQLLNVREGTIRAWIFRRRLAYVRVGNRSVRIPLDALEGLIAEGGQERNGTAGESA